MIITPKDRLITLIKERMVTVENGVTCHSGEVTTTYLDIPGVLADASALRLAMDTFLDRLIGIKNLSKLTAIVGPQMGSIPLVMGFVMHWGDTMRWTVVRDEAKKHGLGSIFVGAKPGPGDKVIITDDVVSSGRSLMETVGVVQATGATVLAIVPLVDRGDKGAVHFAKIGIPYLPVLTYTDLDLPPLGETTS